MPQECSLRCDLYVNERCSKSNHEVRLVTAAHDAAKDVDENRLHVRVRVEDAERLRHRDIRTRTTGQREMWEEAEEGDVEVATEGTAKKTKV